MAYGESPTRSSSREISISQPTRQSTRPRDVLPAMLADQQDDWGFDFINLVTDADRVFVTDEGRDTERPWLVIRETG
jgi:hypothetical protein